jgi:SAM-dependent methyltransferase
MTIEIRLDEIERKLADPDGDFQLASRAALAYLRRHGQLAALLDTLAKEGAQRAAELFFQKAGGQALASTPLFLQALKSGFVADGDIEEFLCAVRRYLLEDPKRAFDLLGDPAYATFAVALAIQLYNNEHVWLESDSESRALQALLSEPFTWKSPADGRRLLCAALYRPVGELMKNCPRDPTLMKALDPGFAAFASSVLKAESEEAAIIKGLDRLTPVENATSKNIASQYRMHPYPRWLGIHRADPSSTRRQLGRIFGHKEAAFLDRPFKVLIAGCGTGAQAIAEAYAYGRNAEILAVDISQASLAYAVRMARRHDLPKLRFALADILELGRIGDRFDVIECAGVLHHLAEPEAGLDVLRSLLEPGGIMYLALYSTAARRDITKLRGRIASEGIPDDPQSLRQFRHRLLFEESCPSVIRQADDVHCLSPLHDLLFNRVEHTYGPGEIAAMLKRARLEFRGFLLDAEARKAFAAHFPQPGQELNLDAWATFELTRPETFRLMYHFWCRAGE